MRINSIFIIFFLCFAYCSGFSQVIADSTSNNKESSYLDKNSDTSEIKKNIVYFELLGNGIYYSLGYGRTLIDKNNRNFSLASGLTYISSRGRESLWISPQILYSTGGSHHRLELGLGYTLGLQYIYTHVIEPKFKKYHYIFYRIGYQYHSKNGKFIYKLALTPLTLFSDGWFFPILPSAGLAICYKF